MKNETKRGRGRPKMTDAEKAAARAAREAKKAVAIGEPPKNKGGRPRKVITSKATIDSIAESKRISVEVARVADRLRNMKDPTGWPKIFQEIGFLALTRDLTPDEAKTIAYLAQCWQSAYKVSEEYRERIKSAENQVFVSVMMNNKPRPARLIDLKDRRELWDEAAQIAEAINGD